MPCEDTETHRHERGWTWKDEALFHQLNVGNNLHIYEKNRKQVWFLLTIEYHTTIKQHSSDYLTAT